MPTAPPAPVRFTTTTGCLSVFSICAASGRPTMSATPPGGNGTTMVIGSRGIRLLRKGKLREHQQDTSEMRDMDLLLPAEINTLLQMLHFIGSLQAVAREMDHALNFKGGCHAEETNPRRRRPRAHAPAFAHDGARPARPRSWLGPPSSVPTTIPVPCVVMPPPHVFYAPPAPVYYAPPPVVYRAAPVYAAPVYPRAGPPCGVRSGGTSRCSAGSC